MAANRQDNRQKPQEGAKKSKLANFGSKRHKLTVEDGNKGAKKSASLRTIRAEQHRNFVMEATAYNIPVEFFKAIDKKLWKKGELLLKAMEKAGFDYSNSEDAAERKQKVELENRISGGVDITVTGLD
jgi:hypothetical protein